jgi:transposase-like protein
MNNPPRNSPTTSPSPQAKRKRNPSPAHSAQDKAQAVLAVWTERCKPAEVCRQLGIRYLSLHQWQHRAMEGMLQALENRVNLKEGRALSPKLQALLARQSRVELSSKLQSKLEQAQNKLASAAEKAA